METNGHDDLGAFTWIQNNILRSLPREGFNGDHLQALQERTAAVSQVIRAFHQQRRELAMSGRYSPRGLAQAVEEIAAKSAAEVRRLLDDAHLRNNIRQTADELKPKKGDPLESLARLWRVREIRQLLSSEGLQTDDVVMGAKAYYEVKAAGDLDTVEALASWPRAGVLPPELKHEARRLEMESRNPLVAQKLSDLEALQEQMPRLLKDALQEMGEAQPDPIAAMARGESTSAGETEAWEG